MYFGRMVHWENAQWHMGIFMPVDRSMSIWREKRRVGFGRRNVEMRSTISMSLSCGVRYAFLSLTRILGKISNICASSVFTTSTSESEVCSSSDDSLEEIWLEVLEQASGLSTHCKHRALDVAHSNSGSSVYWTMATLGCLSRWLM